MDVEAWDEDIEGQDTLIEKHTQLDYIVPSNQWIDKSHQVSKFLLLIQ